MDVNAYIDSGILELYVAGALSDAENEAVYAMMQKHPEVQQEVLQIEAAVMKLTAAASKQDTTTMWTGIKKGIKADEAPKVIPLTRSRYNWVTYTGWAASIVLAAGGTSI